MATSTKIKTVPDGYRLVTTPDGTFYQKIKRSRTKYKTPKAVRNKMSLAARRFKVPVLTTGAVIIPVSMAAKWSGGFNQIFTATGSERFFNHLIGSYTGFMPILGNFRIKRLSRGLLPLLAVMVVRRTGVFRGVNTQLAKSRIPLRLS